MKLEATLEGLLFLCGDDGIEIKEIAKLLSLKYEEVEELIVKMTNNYQKEHRGLCLERYGNICKLVTKSEYNEFYQKLITLNKDKPLTTAGLEVLAIVAYNQPVTRIVVDEIRGIGSAHMLKKLQALELIGEAGRSKLPGCPILYKTTNKFLDTFGLKDLSELPILEKIEETNEKEIIL